MTNSTPGYRKPPEEIDMEEAEHSIQRSSTISSLLAIAGFVAGYYGLPLVIELPVELADRLAFAAIASLFIAVWVLAAVMMVSTTRRFSPEDIGGSAAGPPSDKLAIKKAFLQNTLEQTVITVVFFFALAAVAAGPWIALIVVTVAFFAVGRLLFYRGYAEGVTGRAFGMTLTMIPTFFGYLVVIGLLIARLF